MLHNQSLKPRARHTYYPSVGFIWRVGAKGQGIGYGRTLDAALADFHQKRHYRVTRRWPDGSPDRRMV